MIALVSATVAAHLDEDLPPLRAALDAIGVRHDTVMWDDEGVDWGAYGLVVVRSPWDYMARRDQFVAWAHHVASLSTIVNPPDVLEWNTDKRYLRELAAGGISVVPTTFLEPGDPVTLPDGEIVVKPAVSAGANDTERFSPGERDGAVALATRLLDAGRVVMVQPYIASVDERGETALVFFDGQFSHSITKGPILAPGVGFVEGLYAQETIEPRPAEPDERALAEAVLDLIPGGRERTLYARVDVVRADDGTPMLLELELTEPSVFLAHDATAASRFAAAMASRLA